MKKMSMEKMVRIIAGSLILISLLLAVTVSKWWILFTLFIGVNLIQSAFTGFCPAEMLLAKMGVKKEKDLEK